MSRLPRYEILDEYGTPQDLRLWCLADDVTKLERRTRRLEGLIRAAVRRAKEGSESFEIYAKEVLERE